MDNRTIEVKQSKVIFIITSISCALFESVWGALLIFVIVTWLKGQRNDYFGYVYLLCSLSFLFVAFIVIFVYLLITYKKQKDVYTQDKMCRKKGNKTIFEIPYSQIETVRDGFCSVFFVLNKGIIKTNGKKGSRNFYEHYSLKDIAEIEKLISYYQNYNSK